MPYDVAMKLSPARRLAYAVLIGEIDGGTFDWEQMRFEEDR